MNICLKNYKCGQVKEKIFIKKYKKNIDVSKIVGVKYLGKM